MYLCQCGEGEANIFFYHLTFISMTNILLWGMPTTSGHIIFAPLVVSHLHCVIYRLSFVIIISVNRVNHSPHAIILNAKAHRGRGKTSSLPYIRPVQELLGGSGLAR